LHTPSSARGAEAISPGSRFGCRYTVNLERHSLAFATVVAESEQAGPLFIRRHLPAPRPAHTRGPIPIHALVSVGDLIDPYANGVATGEYTSHIQTSRPGTDLPGGRIPHNGRDADSPPPGGRAVSPLAVVTHAEAVPEPLLVSTHELVAWARHVRSPYAHRQDLASVTVPRLTDDQSDLRYERRGTRETTEFRFTSGALRLELRQCIYLREDLPLLTRGVWLDHEAKHVQDNIMALERLARELRRDPVLRAIFVERRWWQAGWPHMVRATVREGVAGIFWRLATAAALRRDTQAAFARIQRAIGRPPSQGRGKRGEARARPSR
jgi:hypothetical protein